MTFTTGRYGSTEEARAYREKFRGSKLRRGSSRRETALVARALASTGDCQLVLDCPCGAGRLLPALTGDGRRVVAADASAFMVSEARAAGARGVQGFLVADAWRLPFAAGSFDAVVCHRLIHHVRDASLRAALLAELARVARRAVVLSFADATSLKARLQALRRRKPRSRTPIRPEEIDALAAAAGLRRAGPVLRLNRFFSTVAVAAYVKA